MDQEPGAKRGRGSGNFGWFNHLQRLCILLIANMVHGFLMIGSLKLLQAKVAPILLMETLARFLVVPHLPGESC